MAKFASPARTWGECARSGKRMLLKDMVQDGYQPGLMVAPEYYDPVHPQEKLQPIGADAIAVKHPAPDLDRPQVVISMPAYDLTTDTTYRSFISYNYLGSNDIDLSDTYEWVTFDDFMLVTADGDQLVFRD